MPTWLRRQAIVKRLGPAFALALTLTLLTLAGLARPVRSGSGFVYHVTKTADTDDGLCSSSDCSLREALLAANAVSGDDVIILPAGAYTLTIPGAGEDGGHTGDLDVRDSVALSPTGGEALIDAAGIDRVFDVLTGTLALSSARVQGGDPIDAVVAEGAGLDLRASHAGRIDNHGWMSMADTAAGRLDNWGTLVVTRSTLIPSPLGQGSTSLQNWGRASVLSSATGYGVLVNVFNWGELVLTDTQVGPTYGNGLINHGTLRALRARFVHNYADRWIGDFVGALVNDGKATLVESEVAYNSLGIGSAGGSGYPGIKNAGAMSITASTIHGNRLAGYVIGGGAVLNNGTLVISNSTISDNTLNGYSGTNVLGNLRNNGQLYLNNVTLAGNTGGLYVPTGTVTLRNTILAANYAYGGHDCEGTLVSQDYNLIQDLAGCTLTGTITHTLTGLDPLLGALAPNGGPTLTRPLEAGSPARDAGDTATCEPADQRGFPRPHGPACDIGAYEGDPPWRAWLALVTWGAPP